MTSLLRRYFVENDNLSELAGTSSPYLAGALVGAAAWAFGDACAIAGPAAGAGGAGGGGHHPSTVACLPPLFALLSLAVLALVPRSYLASLDEGGGGVFDTGEEGMSASARAKVLLFLAWACAFGSAAGGVALAAGSPAGDARRATLASGSLSSTILTLIAGMVLWFGRGSDDGYDSGYYGY
jgi:hypothetical protein